MVLELLLLAGLGASDDACSSSSAPPPLPSPQPMEDTLAPCEWKYGDGTGGSDERVGSYSSADACARAVRQTYPQANGATYGGAGGTQCFAEIGMSGFRRFESWRTCLFGGWKVVVPSSPPAPLAPVTHEIVSADASAAPDLIAQSLRPIRRAVTHLAHDRRVPFAPPLAVDAAYLARQHEGTRAFLDMQLSRDPRLQPSDVVVNTDHMRQCTSCAHDRGLHQALHGEAVLDIGNGTQLLVDDWAIHSWQNSVRQLEPPAAQHRLILGSSGGGGDGDARFGCPCSAFETAERRVQLTYQSGTGPRSGSGAEWTHEHMGIYKYSTSADGVSGWSEPQGPITVNGKGQMGTLTIKGGARGARYSLPSHQAERAAAGSGRPHDPAAAAENTTRLRFLAGYEGWRSRACFAASDDGVTFSNLDNDHDRRDPHLNDDWCEPAGDRPSAPPPPQLTRRT